MAVTAYLYRAWNSSEGQAGLPAKIAGSVGVTPTAVYSGPPYLYAQFAAALTADEKSMLDSFASARGAVFAATDSSPNTSLLGFGRSPDGSFWRETIDDVGIPTTAKVQ
jgi:hypothetical protein